MNISVILNTCNRADYLNLSLIALARQTHKDFEIIIADDGSTDHTRQVIEKAKESLPYRIVHVWQKQEGFRKTKILNKSVNDARHDYIFFTDGDCLMCSDVLENHVRYFSPDHFLLGGALRLSEEYSQSLDAEAVESGKYEEQLDAENLKRLRRLARRAKFQTFLRKKRAPHIYGVNFSLTREAFTKINGYDENFEGWGNEDGDLTERLKMIGLRPRPIFEEAVAFHMHHPRHPTASLRLNRTYSRRSNIPARCLNGMVEPRGNEEL